MATIGNQDVNATEWTAILTSADGKATIETRDAAIEYAYSTTSLAGTSIRGLTLPPSRFDPKKENESSFNYLRISPALASGITLYAKSLSGNTTVVISKDSEVFGA